jgi:hypothetical protein
MAPPPGSVAWWPFDETSGKTARDVIGRSDGTYVGSPAPAPGKVMRALQLNGRDYVEMPGGDLDVDRDDFSLAAWVQTSDRSGGVTVLVDKRTLGASAQGYSLWLNKGKPGVQLADGRGPARCSNDPKMSCTNYDANVAISDGAWHFIAVTVDRRSNTGGKFYVDGKSAGVFDPTIRGGSLRNSGAFRVGSVAGAPGSFFRGKIDELLFARRALGAQEVGAIYAAGSAGMCKPRLVPISGTATKVELIGETAYRVSIDGQPFSRPLPVKPRIELRYRPFEPLSGGAPAVPSALRQDDSEVWIVQFITPPIDAYRQAIKSLGGATYTFLPDQALLTWLPPEARRALQTQPFVRWMGPYHPAYKLEEALRDPLKSPRPGAATRYSIQLLDRGAFASPVLDRIKSLGGKVDMTNGVGFRIEATLTDAQLLAVARLWQVLFIDRWSPPQNDMDNVREIGGANYLTAIAGYSGQGVRGEVLDNGLRTSHGDFAAIAPVIHTGNGSINNHGTPVYAIVFGTGASDAKGRGLLPAAQGIFSSYDVLTDRHAHTAELIDATKPYHASFQTNSWGNGLTTTYSTISADFDDILFNNNLLVTQSQSNTGNTMSRPQAWAKNVVSVGGIKHFDDLNSANDQWGGSGSIGPEADGRLKPDLSNFYDATWTASNSTDTAHADFGGTSGATPITAGHFGLLFEMWADGVFSGGPGKALDVFTSRPKATTAKALMINSASQYPFTGTGSDLTRVHQGWGRADVGNLYRIARKDRWHLPLLIDQTSILAPFGIRPYTVNVGGNAADVLWFKATLVYPDPAGNPAASKHRVNDLTLRVTAPDGTSYWGNNGLNAGVSSTSGGSPNDVDTVENVFLPDGPPGDYKVEVLADAIVQDAFPATPELDSPFSLVVTRALGSCTQPPSGMIGWWAFDGLDTNAIPNPVSDIQGGHDGTSIGQIGRHAGQVRTAASFADSSYIEVPDDPALDFGASPGGDFSIDAWFSFPFGEAVGSDGAECVVAQKLEGVGPERGYSLFLLEGTPTTFQLEIADGTATIFSSQVSAMLDGWHHIAVTVDRDSSTGGHWYLDGVEITSAQFDPTPRSGSLANASTLKMGKLAEGIPWALDEVEIFGRVLTGPEVMAIYLAGSQGKCKPDVWVDDTPWYDTSLAPDTGEEPDANMLGKDIWASRAIWIRQSGTCSGTTVANHQNAEFGQTNKICVQVTNRGQRTAASTTVEAYWANPSTGLTWGTGLWTMADSKVITNLPAGGQQIAELDWTNVPDPTLSPNGHFCLVARLVSTEDPMSYPEGQDLGANVVFNNNVSWRNVNVDDLTHKTSGTATVHVRNVKREPAAIDLRFRGRDGFIVEGGVVFVDLGQLFAPWRSAGGKGHNVVLVEGTKVKLQSLPATVEGIPMAPVEDRTIVLTAQALQPLKREGKSHHYTFDVVEAITGKEVGGVSYDITARGLDADTDGDGIPDINDPDDDGDGVPDDVDTNPLDPRVGKPGCPRGAPTVVLRGLHYPKKDFPTCAAATAAAESPAALASPRYRQACAGPNGVQPPTVLGARVVSCAVSPPLSQDSVVVDVEVCCLVPCVLDAGIVAAGNTFARRPNALAQTFTPTQSGTLTQVTHGLQSISTITSYDLLITTTSSGMPTWNGGPHTGPNVLYSTPAPVTIFSTNAMVNGAVPITPGLHLTAGTIYALVLIPGPPANGLMAWRGNSSAGSYRAGSAYELNGTVWSVPTTGPKDHGFKLNGTCP